MPVAYDATCCYLNEILLSVSNRTSPSSLLNPLGRLNFYFTVRARKKKKEKKTSESHTNRTLLQLQISRITIIICSSQLSVLYLRSSEILFYRHSPPLFSFPSHVSSYRAKDRYRYIHAGIVEFRREVGGFIDNDGVCAAALGVSPGNARVIDYLRQIAGR